MTTPLRIGILINEAAETIPAWAVDMIDRLQQSDSASITTVIQVGRADAPQQPMLYRLFKTLEKRVVKLKHDPFAQHAIGSVLPHVDVIRWADTQAISLDIVININVANVAQELLALPTYGIWQYEHGSNPAGFWEVMLDEDVTGLSVCQMTDTEMKTLVTSFSPTQTPFPRRNLYYFAWRMAVMIPQEIERLAHLGAESYFDYVADKTPLPKRHMNGIPNNLALIWYAVRYYIGYFWGKLFRLRTDLQWHLLFTLDADNATNYASYQPMLPPDDRFWADPHVVYRDNTYYIFIEELKFKDNKGYLAVIEMDAEGNFAMPRTILEKPYHLSYPYIFDYDGKTYLLPESASNRTIDLYQATNFPDTWEHVMTLMDDVEAYDTTIFEWDNTWWLFTTLQEQRVGSTCDDLYIFYSDNPLSSAWQPHPLNPVISDARRARMAGGIFEKNGDLYRPTQDDSTDYGYGVRIHRIIELSINGYQEEEVEFIEPIWHPKLKGIHTYSVTKNLIMMDAVHRIRQS